MNKWDKGRNRTRPTRHNYSPGNIERSRAASLTAGLAVLFRQSNVQSLRSRESSISPDRVQRSDCIHMCVVTPGLASLKPLFTNIEVHLTVKWRVTQDPLNNTVAYAKESCTQRVTKKCQDCTRLPPPSAHSMSSSSIS